MSLPLAVLYVAKKIESDLPDLGLTPEQENVIDGYIDMLQLSVISSGVKEGIGELCSWVKDRHRGLAGVKRPANGCSRKISVGDET
jgi:hypothetical protein